MVYFIQDWFLVQGRVARMPQLHQIKDLQDLQKLNKLRGQYIKDNF